MAPKIASKASPKIELLSLPPVNSSPLLSKRYFPTSNFLEIPAKTGSLTTIDLTFAKSPSVELA